MADRDSALEQTTSNKAVPENWSQIGLNIVLAQQPRLFLGYGNQPSIVIPGDDRAHSINSRRVHAWISKLCWEIRGHVLYGREIRQISTILEGMAWEMTSESEVDATLWDAVEQEPIFEVLNDFMLAADNDHCEFSVGSLYVALKKHAKQMGIRLSNRKWPKSASSMSAKLNGNQGLLQDLGLSFERWRNNKARRVTIRRRQTRDQSDSSRGTRNGELAAVYEPASCAGPNENIQELERRLLLIKENNE